MPGLVQRSTNGNDASAFNHDIPAHQNLTGAIDHTLNGFSTLQVSWQPAVNDLRHPSGYILTIYKVDNDSEIEIHREIRMGHIGGIGARQVINLPPMATIEEDGDQGAGPNGEILPGFILPQNGAYLIKVRNVWMEGTDGAAGHSFDMGKAPFAQRFPMAYADVISGVFIVRY